MNLNSIIFIFYSQYFIIYLFLKQELTAEGISQHALLYHVYTQVLMSEFDHTSYHNMDSLDVAHDHAGQSHEHFDDILCHFAACQIQAVYRGYYARTHSSHFSQMTVLAFDDINKEWVQKNHTRIRKKSSCTTSVSSDVGNDVWCDHDSVDEGNDEHDVFHDVKSAPGSQGFISQLESWYRGSSDAGSQPASPTKESTVSALSALSPKLSPSPSPTKEKTETSHIKPVVVTPLLSPVDRPVQNERSSPKRPSSGDNSTPNAVIPFPFPVLETGAPSFELWSQTVALDSPNSSQFIASGESVSLLPTVCVSGYAPEATLPPPVDLDLDPFDVCMSLAAISIQAFYRSYYVRTRVTIDEVAHLRLRAEAVAEMRNYRRIVDAELEKERLRVEKAQSKLRYQERMKAEKAESKRLFLERKRAAAKKENLVTQTVDSDSDVAVDLVEHPVKVSAAIVAANILQSISLNSQNQLLPCIDEIKPIPALAAPKQKLQWIPMHSWDEFLALIAEDVVFLHCAASELQALYRGHYARRHQLRSEVAHIEMWREAIREMKQLRQDSDAEAAAVLAEETERLRKEESERAAVHLQNAALLAVKLQAVFRGGWIRRHIQEAEQAFELVNQMAVRVQARFRGYRVRLEEYRSDMHVFDIMLRFAVRLQAVFRGRRTRKLMASGHLDALMESDPVLVDEPAPVVEASKKFIGSMHSWDEFLALIAEDVVFLHCAASELQALYRGHYARRHQLRSEVAHIEMWREVVSEISSFRLKEDRVHAVKEAEVHVQNAELTRMRAESMESRRVEAERVKFGSFLQQEAVVVKLQARVRGSLCRSTLQYTRRAFEEYDAATRIQALCRGHKCRIAWAQAMVDHMLLEFESELAVGAMRVQFTLDAMVAAEAESEMVYNMELVRLQNDAEVRLISEDALISGDKEIVRARAASEDELTVLIGSEVEQILLQRSLGEEESVPEPLSWAEEEAERLGEEADALVEKLIITGQSSYYEDKQTSHGGLLREKLALLDRDQAKCAASVASAASRRVRKNLNVAAALPVLGPDVSMQAASSVPNAAVGFELAAEAARSRCEAAGRETQILARQVQVHRAYIRTREEQEADSRRHKDLQIASAVRIQCIHRAVQARKRLLDLQIIRRFEEEEAERTLLEEQALLAAEEEALELENAVTDAILTEQAKYLAHKEENCRVNLMQKLASVDTIRAGVKTLLSESPFLVERRTSVGAVCAKKKGEDAVLLPVPTADIANRAVKTAQSVGEEARCEMLRLSRQKEVHFACENDRLSRGCSLRRVEELKTTAAVCIQCLHRCAVARRTVAAIRTDRAAENRSVAVLHIQMSFRTFCARRNLKKRRLEAFQGAEANVQDAEANVQGVEANVQGAEANVQGAEANVQGVEANVQDVEANVQGAEANVQGAEANVQGVEANVQDVEANVQGAEANVQGAEAKVEQVSAEDTTVQQHLDLSEGQMQGLRTVPCIQAVVRGHQLRSFFKACREEAMSLDAIDSDSLNSSTLSVPTLTAGGEDQEGGCGDAVSEEQKPLVVELDVGTTMDKSPLLIEPEQQIVLLAHKRRESKRVRLVNLFRQAQTSGSTGAGKERAKQDLILTETDEI